MYKIIERIAPEIIFGETSPNGFVAIFEGSLPGSLETYTIGLYSQKHPIIRVPVDLDGNELVHVRHLSKRKGWPIVAS